MVKPGLGFLSAARRKSSGNAYEEPEPTSSPDVGPGADAGGFRLMDRDEVKARKIEEQKRKQEKASKFRFSGFGSNAHKGRNQSFDEESPASSNRDSKSSTGTQSSRPYNNGQFGSTSTLPSSADTDPPDNIFAHGPPRPYIPQHNSSPNTLSMAPMGKQLPAIPRTDSKQHYEPASPTAGIGRVRAMTSSSYASTAKAPALDQDLNFGSTSFDDMFSGIDRKESPDYANDSAGRSLLAGKRAYQVEPINVDRKLSIDEPLKSWDSRGSGDNLMSSPRSPDNDSPPPVPPHKSSRYAPVASHSPEFNGSNGFDDADAKIVRRSVMARKSVHESSPERNPTSVSSSSAVSLQTPLSSRSASNNTTPKAALRSATSPLSEDDDDNLFAPSKRKDTPVRKPAAPARKETAPPAVATSESGRRVLTQAEFRAQQQRQSAQPLEESSDSEDYEDEEEVIERAQQEAMARRKKQQLDIARETLWRTTTAPASSGRPDGGAEQPLSMGFPSETSLQADEWSDEDIPLAILAQHGCPSISRNRPPTQPANAIPSYFRNSTPSLPERPASAGAMSSRMSQAHMPAFARNLPEDPHASFIGGGLVRPTNRESLGFNRGPASIAGEPAGGMPMSVMGYQEPQLTAPSLVEQIHMRDMSKQKYTGGASSKRPQQGPFTGMLGNQMNGPNQNSTRMSYMPGMNGMTGIGGMPNMMGGQMGMPFIGMGMNQMAYPMTQNEQLMQMQMQQMLAQQQFQMQMQMQGFPAPQQQDPRVSMAFPNPGPGNPGNGFLNVPNSMNQRPMSIMSHGSTLPQQRPFSTPQMGGSYPSAPAPQNGYTPSIAPSERSNIGLSARYRPVATSHNDAVSTVSSMTLQASGGATQGAKTVKGILKNKSPQGTPQGTLRNDDDDDDGWAKMMNQRKSKFTSNAASTDDGAALRELVHSVDRF